MKIAEDRTFLLSLLVEVIVFIFYLGGRFYEILSVIVISAGVNLWTTALAEGLPTLKSLILTASGVAFYFFGEEVKDYDARARNQQQIENRGMKREHLRKLLWFDFDKHPAGLGIKIILLISALAATSVAFSRIADEKSSPSPAQKDIVLLLETKPVISEPVQPATPSPAAKEAFPLPPSHPK